jgi:hypothetical protein
LHCQTMNSSLSLDAAVSMLRTFDSGLTVRD